MDLPLLERPFDSLHNSLHTVLTLFRRKRLRSAYALFEPSFARCSVRLRVAIISATQGYTHYRNIMHMLPDVSYIFHDIMKCRYVTLYCFRSVPHSRPFLSPSFHIGILMTRTSEIFITFHIVLIAVKLMRTPQLTSHIFY